MRGTWGTRRVVMRGEGGFWAFVVMQEGDQGGVEAGEGVVSQACGFAHLGLGEALAFAVENQFCVVDEGHAMGVGKPLSAFSYEVDVSATFKDEASSLNGVAQALDTSHAASFHAAAVHEEGVELNVAVGGEKAAMTGVEGGVVFEDGDGRFNSVESRGSARDKVVSNFKRVTNSSLMGGSGIGGDGPCATVDKKSGNVDSGGSHLNIVEHLAGCVETARLGIDLFVYGYCVKEKRMETFN